MNVVKKLKHTTLEEFAAMEKDERFNYELIDGVVMMSPSPSREHQIISFRLQGNLFLALKNTACQGACEYDIKCGEAIFKPDVMVFCNPDVELPEIIFEIISPSSKYRDLVIKVAKYEEADIKEYWIIDPKIKTVTVHDFVNQTTEIYGINDTIQSKAIPEIIIAVADIFPSPKSEHIVNTLF